VAAVPFVARVVVRSDSSLQSRSRPYAGARTLLVSVTRMSNSEALVALAADSCSYIRTADGALLLAIEAEPFKKCRQPAGSSYSTQ
jgi:hypothetical protein